MNIVWLFLAVVWFLPWTDEAGTQKAAKALGFTNVQTTGHSFFSCMSDWSATEFKAVSPTGQKTEGIVCCGLFFKACTMRF